MATKKKKVTFLKSPTGLFKLGYHVGDHVEFPPKQADELVESGVAVLYLATKKKTKDSDETIENTSKDSEPTKEETTESDDEETAS